MRKVILILIFNLLIISINAQNNITLNGVTINGEEVEQDIWIFQNSVDTILALKYKEYKALNKKLEELLVAQIRLDSILKAKNDLIAAFENYEDKADKHIDTQSKLIQVGDSLYTGYKGLYNDLKDIYGMSTFSVIIGSGAFNDDNTSWKPYINLGVAYKKFQGNYQFNKTYKGINLQYVIPVF